MNTSQIVSKSKKYRNEPFTPAELGYFDSRAKSKAHEMVLRLFMSMARDGRINRSTVALLLNKKPEQITRWLSAPGNWTIETLARLLLAMGHEPEFSSSPLNRPNSGCIHAYENGDFRLFVSEDGKEKYSISLEAKSHKNDTVRINIMEHEKLNPPENIRINYNDGLNIKYINLKNVSGNKSDFPNK